MKIILVGGFGLAVVLIGILLTLPVMRNNNEILKEKSLPKYITDTKPVVDTSDKRLRVSVNSSALEPVVSVWVCSQTLGADGQPVCTGVEPIPGSDLRRKVEDLPNSYYTETGQGIYVGFDTENIHTIKLSGIDAGTFTLEIEEVTGDSTSATLTYSDVPTVYGAVAEISLRTIDTVSPLRLDMDGDGAFETSVSPVSSSLSPL